MSAIAIVVSRLIQPFWLWSICLAVALAAPAQAAGQAHGAPAAGAQEISPQTIAAARKVGRSILLIDVRTPAEFAAGHAEDAINVPLERLRARMAELQVPKSTEIVTMCVGGARSSRAAVELKKMGYKTASYCPLKKWQEAGFKTQTARPARKVHARKGA